ncbi:MAG: Tad domain-containing protein [Chloroflexota bacterium]
MKRNHASESGQVMILMAIGFVILLGFVALALDGGMAYADRRHVQNAADASSLAGGGAAALSIENSHVFYSSWNCSDGRVIAAENAAVTAAVSRAADNNLPVTGSSTPGDNVVTAICGQEIQNGFTDKYIDITTYISTTTNTSFLQWIYGGKLINNVQAVTRVRPRSPLAFGNAVVALNPQNCQGQQNGLTIHGTADTYVTGGGMFSNGCMRAVGNAQATVTGGGVTYAGNFDGNPSAYHPMPQYTSQKLPAGSYEVAPPDCHDPAAHNIDGRNLRGSLQPGLYCVTGQVQINAHDTLIGNGVTIYLVDGSLRINGNATVQLSAPVANPDPSPAIAGMVIYLNPTNQNEVQINGNSDSFFQGTIYAPGSDIDVLGTAVIDAYRSQVIGWNVELGGTADTNVVFQENLQYSKPSTLELYK